MPPAALKAQGVAKQEVKAETLGHERHLRANVAHADNSQRSGSVEADTSGTGKEQEGALNILRHTARVAARTIGPSDAIFREPGGVDVVETDGGRGNEFHATAIEQGFIAAGAGSHNEGISIAHVIGGDGSARKINGGAEALCLPAHKWYFVVNDDFHTRKRGK